MQAVFREGPLGRAALIVSVVTLVAALGGVSYAATELGKNSVGSKQLKKGSVGKKQLKKNAVTDKAVKEASISGTKLKPGTIPTSLPPHGPAGGALTGSYPSPGLAANTVGAAQLRGMVTRNQNAAVPAGATETVIASCQPGEVAISGGGGFIVPGPDRTISFESRLSSTAWRVTVVNGTVATQEAGATVDCLRP